MTHHRPATELPERLPPWANSAKGRDWAIREALQQPGWYADTILARLKPAAGGCQVWTGTLSKDGYGRVGIPKGKWASFVHRVTYLAAHGEIPEGHVIDHVCGVKSCANPPHLEAVTVRENNARAPKPSIFAINAAKTHCPQGHPLAGANLLPAARDRGYRSCLACARQQAEDRQRLIRRAAEHLGLTVAEYRRRHGGSIEEARNVLAPRPSLVAYTHREAR